MATVLPECLKVLRCNTIKQMLLTIPTGLEHVMNIDPEILGGEPCFAGTRIPLDTVVDNLGAGYGAEEIRSNFPSLTEEHIRAVQHWELALAREATGMRRLG